MEQKDARMQNLSIPVIVDTTHHLNKLDPAHRRNTISCDGFLHLTISG